jgi:phenylalanine-4-hydroxylase
MNEPSDFHRATETLELEPISAYVKAAQNGTDPRCIPNHLEGMPPISKEILYPHYPENDHQTWRILYEQQTDILPNRACNDFMKGKESLGLNPTQIPKLAELSMVLESRTNWRIARIPGLLHEQDFFKLLGERIFPSTDYIRAMHELGYTPAPDLFHDIFGHLPMLTNPDFADFYQLFGRAALNAKGKDRTSLERLHWFAVEFGLIKEKNETRIFGAGTLSSPTEVMNSLSEKVTVYPFEVEQVINQDYDVWHLQPILFSINSFEELKEQFKKWTVDRQLL